MLLHCDAQLPVLTPCYSSYQSYVQIVKHGTFSHHLSLVDSEPLACAFAVMHLASRSLLRVTLLTKVMCRLLSTASLATIFLISVFLVPDVQELYKSHSAGPGRRP